MLSFITLFALLGAVVNAQNSTQVPTTVSQSLINGVVANYQNAQITPQFLPSLNLAGTLEFNYGNGSVPTGTLLAQSAVQNTPIITLYSGLNTTGLFSNSSKYTVGMIDARAVGTDETTTPQVRHWLVNNVSLSGPFSPYTLNFDGSTSITNYAGPAPPANDGAHRYIFVVYAQPSTFVAPSNLTAGSPVGTFFFNTYVQSSGLGQLLATNYYTVQTGTNSSIPSTSAVQSSTLASTAAFSSTGASGTGTGTGTATGTGASAAATSTKSGAGKKEVAWGMVLGAAGVVGCVVAAGVGL